MKLDLLFVSLILGIGLALLVERVFGFPPVVVKTTSTAASSAFAITTGNPVRDFMNTHYPG